LAGIETLAFSSGMGLKTPYLLRGGYNNAENAIQNNVVWNKETNNVVGIEIINVVSIKIIMSSE
jgi:hypothetical protein